MKGLLNLDAIARRLNAATEAINEYIRNVETSLNALNVGVEAWLEEPLVGIRDEHYWQLGYGRVESGWAVVVRPCFVNVLRDDNGGVTLSVRPEASRLELLRCARTLRVGAVPYLPALVEAIRTQALDTAQEIEAVVKRVDPKWEQPSPRLVSAPGLPDSLGRMAMLDGRGAQVDHEARDAGHKKHMKLAKAATKDLSR